jgi:uncharacterized protein (TIGR03437 family)
MMMKRIVGITASLFALLLAISISARAEVYTASVLLTAGGEVNPNPAPPPTATGVFLVTINVTRDNNGVVTGGSMNFSGSIRFPGAVTVRGLHIHEQDIVNNGPIRFDTGLSATNNMVFPTGVGFISQNVMNVDPAVLGRLLAKPTGFYVNLHTNDNPAGAIRAQIVRLVESQAITVQMSTAQEVPPITTVTAGGVGTITVNPVRNPANGAITGGSVTFTVSHDLPANSNIVGLHIHEQVAGVNGPIVIDTGLSGANSLATATGKGMINYEVPLTTSAQIGVVQRLLANPTGFYTNLHTQANPGGVIRGQLTALSLAAPPIIHQSSAYFLETGNTDAQISMFVTGADLATNIHVNGQPVFYQPDLATGLLNVTIPAALRANAGTLFIQARTGDGLMSTPVQIVVAPAANVNASALVTADAARFGTTLAPGAIGAGFGSKLASQALPSPRRLLPTSLDGTSVFVNGIAAGLFYVSVGQVNYLIPVATVAGPASVVVVAKDGAVTRGQLTVAGVIPAIFTSNSTGSGAPSALASTDGTNFNILVGNPDGTPNEISAGNFVALFGTGMDFPSTAATIKIGTTDVTPMFVGSQGEFPGVSQVNLKVPESLAGAGLVDLIITIDGKPSNAVRLRIK